MRITQYQRGASAREKQLRDCISSMLREMASLQTRLGSNARPGHVDYISKSDAAMWLSRLTVRLHRETIRTQIRRKGQ